MYLSGEILRITYHLHEEGGARGTGHGEGIGGQLVFAACSPFFLCDHYLGSHFSTHLHVEGGQGRAAPPPMCEQATAYKDFLEKKITTAGQKMILNQRPPGTD